MKCAAKRTQNKPAYKAGIHMIAHTVIITFVIGISRLCNKLDYTFNP